jgi:hypothetical protein
MGHAFEQQDLDGQAVGRAPIRPIGRNQGGKLPIVRALESGLPPRSGFAAAGPHQMLPSFWQWLYEWLPLRFITDGERMLLSHQGGLSGLAETPTRVLASYAVGSLLHAALVVGVRDALARRVEQGTEGDETADFEGAGLAV